jgi:hypothetical protein
MVDLHSTVQHFIRRFLFLFSFLVYFRLEVGHHDTPTEHNTSFCLESDTQKYSTRKK